MEDSAWPYEAKLDTYLEAARTHYAPSLEQRTERSLLTLLGVFQAALGAPRRREVMLWQRVDFPERLPGLFTRELPGAREGPGHVDARRARGARRLGEPPPAQRGLVAARLTRLEPRQRLAHCELSLGSGDSYALPPSGRRGSGHSPRNTPQLHVEAGHDPRVHHPDVGEQRLAAAERRALLRASSSSPPTTKPPLQAQPAVGVVLVPVVVRAREAGRRTARGGTRGSSGRRSSSRASCRRTAAPTDARDRSDDASPMFV